MDRICTYVLSMLFPFLWATSSLAQPADDWNRWGHMMSWGWGHMMFGGVMMIVFWGGIILRCLTRSLVRRQQVGWPQRPPAR